MANAVSEGNLLAYCGFYCGDCMGHTGVIADAAERFKAVLDEYRFRKTAEAMFEEQLGGFGKFEEMVAFMSGLRCPTVCRERADSSCSAKDCCIEKGYFACYECDGFETCETLRAAQVGIHEEACMLHLRAIREMGLDAWLESGERHTYWTLDREREEGGP